MDVLLVGGTRDGDYMPEGPQGMVINVASKPFPTPEPGAATVKIDRSEAYARHEFAGVAVYAIVGMPPAEVMQRLIAHYRPA